MLTGLLLSSFACLKAKDSAASKAGQATICIYRGGEFNGAFNNRALFIDGKKNAS